MEVTEIETKVPIPDGKLREESISSVLLVVIAATS